MVQSSFPIANAFMGSAVRVAEMALALDLEGTALRGALLSLAYLLTQERDEGMQLVEWLVAQTEPELIAAMHDELENARCAAIAARN